MLRRSFLFLLLILAFSTLPTHADDFKPAFFPIDQDGKWGFINASGKIVIPLAFEEARFFFEGLAVVRVGEKYGFINERGETVIAPQYQEVWNFRDGLASVKNENGEWKFIDRTGKMAFLAPSSHRFIEFRDGLARALPPWVHSDIHPPSPDSLLVLYGFISKTGDWVIQPTLGAAGNFSEGLAIFTPDAQPFTKPTKYGFIDTRGKVVIAPRFDDSAYFKEGLANVKENGRKFFIDKTGVRAFAGDYEDTEEFNDGLASVKIGGKWGFINNKGLMVIPPKFEEVGSFHSGRASFKGNGKWGYIDQSGAVVVPAIYDYARSFLGELAWVTLGVEPGNGAGRGYINRDGKIIWAPQPRAKKPAIKEEK